LKGQPPTISLHFEEDRDGRLEIMAFKAFVDTVTYDENTLMCTNIFKG
jgi:hypothetical protein